MHRSLLALFSLLLLLALAGCSKDGGDPGFVNALPASAAAELGAAALGGDGSQGATAQMTALAALFSSGAARKASGEMDVRPFDTTIVRDRSEGAVTYHYVITYRVTLSNFANRADVATTVKGTLDTPRLSSTDSATSDMALTHLVDAESTVTVNGSWRRGGQTHLKGPEPHTFSSVLVATFTDVRISKATNEIVSGSALLTLSGSVSGGGTFFHGVQVTFTGGGQAQLVINNVLYIADLASGTIVPTRE